MGIYSNVAASTPPAANLQRPVLLIVDDEQGPRESLRMVFKDRYRCLIATSGREGIELARANKPDAAILDIRMPDLSGVEVLREIKQLDPNVEVVMLTGYETVETARAAVHHGAADYLNKPFDVFVLRELLEKCLERRQRRFQLEQGVEELRSLRAEVARQNAETGRIATASAMSAGVVHELNNPLSIVAGYAELLSRDLDQMGHGGPIALQDMQNRLSSIQKEVFRCKEIADRFLRFSRAGGDQTERVEVPALLDDVAALLRAHPERGAVAITVEPAPAAFAIQVHPGQMMQVLLNFGINALQAMQGDGELRLLADVATAPTEFAYESPTLDPTKPLVRISISDTGPGVAPEVLSKLFTPYVTTKPNGHGLGLAITAELIGRHRGAIAVQSTVGSGTTFSVYLPAAA